tara:strand:+ start:89 stop:652 length:564 start_codon:yes stop_codon:yes gene_type:complete
MAEELKRVVFCWGRMNPPTIGHEKLINFTIDKAGRDPWWVMATHSEGGEKNPISYENKIKYLKKMFPKHADHIYEGPESRTIIKVMQYLQPNYDHVVGIVGADQFAWLNMLLPKQNGTSDYTFDKIEVLNAGARSADAKGAAGASSSKQKGFVRANNVPDYCSYLPDTLTMKEKIDLFKLTKKGMGL